MANTGRAIQWNRCVVSRIKHKILTRISAFFLFIFSTYLSNLSSVIRLFSWESSFSNFSENLTQFFLKIRYALEVCMGPSLADEKWFFPTGWAGKWEAIFSTDWARTANEKWFFQWAMLGKEKYGRQKRNEFFNSQAGL